MYLDRNKILSYNPIMAFIVLKRGYGKSYGFKTRGVDKFLSDGLQTVWARRYKGETSETVDGFFDDIKSKYSEHTLEIKGRKGYVNGKIAFHFITLSTAQRIKSKAFTKVFQLVFDEFLIESGNLTYISNECKLFSGLLSTVFRDRRMQVFLLGNKTSIVNPYSIYFNLADFDTVKFYSDRKILIYAQDGDGVIEKNYLDSDLETVLRGSAYYDYNFLNKSLDNTDGLIKKRPSHLKTHYTITIGDTIVGVFIDTSSSSIYFDTHCDKSVKLKFVFNKENMAESFFLLTKQLPFGKVLKDAFRNGRLYFADYKTKEVAKPFINYLV